MRDHPIESTAERRHIHELFEAGEYVRLFREQPEVLGDMLMIESADELEDLLDEGCPIEEDLFWLFYSVHQGKCLLIEPYAEDVSKAVAEFLLKELPIPLFQRVQEHVAGMYVDLGTKDNLPERVSACCKALDGSRYSLHLDYDDTFSDGLYFMSVRHS